MSELARRLDLRVMGSLSPYEGAGVMRFRLIVNVVV